MHRKSRRLIPSPRHALAATNDFLDTSINLGPFLSKPRSKLRCLFPTLSNPLNAHFNGHKVLQYGAPIVMGVVYFLLVRIAMSKDVGLSMRGTKKRRGGKDTVGIDGIAKVVIWVACRSERAVFEAPLLRHGSFVSWECCVRGRTSHLLIP